MKLLNKAICFLFLIVGAFYNAQTPPVPGGDDGGGGTGTGAPASPIDMYLFVLVLVAGALLFYYHRKTQKNLI